MLSLGHGFATYSCHIECEHSCISKGVLVTSSFDFMHCSAGRRARATGTLPRSMRNMCLTPSMSSMTRCTPRLALQLHTLLLCPRLHARSPPEALQLCIWHSARQRWLMAANILQHGCSASCASCSMYIQGPQCRDVSVTTALLRLSGACPALHGICEYRIYDRSSLMSSTSG